MYFTFKDIQNDIQFQQVLSESDESFSGVYKSDDNFKDIRHEPVDGNWNVWTHSENSFEDNLLQNIKLVNEFKVKKND